MANGRLIEVVYFKFKDEKDSPEIEFFKMLKEILGNDFLKIINKKKNNDEKNVVAYYIALYSDDIYYKDKAIIMKFITSMLTGVRSMVWVDILLNVLDEEEIPLSEGNEKFVIINNFLKENFTKKQLDELIKSDDKKAFMNLLIKLGEDIEKMKRRISKFCKELK